MSEQSDAPAVPVDVTPWRKEFAGDDPGNLEYFDGFSWPGVLKASHAELSRR